MVTFKNLLRVAAIYLWYFPFLFLFIVLDTFLGIGLLVQGTWFSEQTVRFPYQYDYEFMFAVVYGVWGFFLWKASNNITQQTFFVAFTGVSFLLQGISMLILAFSGVSPLHLFFDSIPWIVLGATILFLRKHHFEFTR